MESMAYLLLDWYGFKQTRNLFLSYWIQTSQTGGKPFSETSPYKVSEYYLAQRINDPLWLETFIIPNDVVSHAYMRVSKLQIMQTSIKIYLLLQLECTKFCVWLCRISHNKQFETLQQERVSITKIKISFLISRIDGIQQHRVKQYIANTEWRGQES